MLLSLSIPALKLLRFIDKVYEFTDYLPTASIDCGHPGFCPEPALLIGVAARLRYSLQFLGRNYLG
jgi:hypothetical protein